MYCQSCGMQLQKQMKYCNRCGAQLIKPDSGNDIRRSEKRLDKYLEGLFWVTVLGLAFIFGGLIVLKKFGFDGWVFITFVSLSSTAFLTNFVVNLWGTIRLMKGQSEIPELQEQEHWTKELDAGLSEPATMPASVTENTTRAFEPVVNKRL